MQGTRVQQYHTERNLLWGIQCIRFGGIVTEGVDARLFEGIAAVSTELVVPF